jgi:hypothetical protein
VAITGRTPKDCFEQFRDHVSKLISDTIGIKVPLLCLFAYGSNKATLSFWETEAGKDRRMVPKPVPIDTNYGRVHFYLAQDVEADPRAKQFVLRTKRYWYRLQATSGYREQALIRWEFTKQPTDQHCRHHVQIGGRINFGNGFLDLNDAHTATGYVFIEFILRFLIADLGVKAKDGWEQALKKSEEVLFSEFVPGSASGK